MKTILVTYTTNAGSTEEVAETIAGELRQGGSQVEVCRLKEVTSLARYDAVVIGAPMILGWHRDAVSFVKKHQNTLAQIPVAYFCTLMSLTQTSQESIGGVSICVDPWLPKPPKNENRLSFKENYATQANYLRPVLKAAPAVHPVQIGFFGGKMEIFRLKWWQALFVMAIIQAAPGDRRNWKFIKEWAAGLRPVLLAGEQAGVKDPVTA